MFRRIPEGIFVRDFTRGAFFGAKAHVVVVVRVPKTIVLHAANELAVSIPGADNCVKFSEAKTSSDCNKERGRRGTCSHQNALW